MVGGLDLSNRNMALVVGRRNLGGLDGMDAVAWRSGLGLMASKYSLGFGCTHVVVGMVGHGASANF